MTTIENVSGNGFIGTTYPGYSSPKTTTKKTTTVKKKFDKEGKVVSETTTTVEESVTTYSNNQWYSTNATDLGWTSPLGEVTYK